MTSKKFERCICGRLILPGQVYQVTLAGLLCPVCIRTTTQGEPK